ncbi:S-layer family protein [Arthrobacter sp. ISL-5]|uniref:beta strand repeat-containing protein n=1 Tax=Arthrobacter sp. ISL-5 TaxID=2819111 RepID=UPI001BEB3BFA|nr:carboxypeptidase regulatory-like domain-containing protein [Arthrobacter sp. ISL-5]MBT2552778.1 carboxypeptidase regulatory-like domain-containing protein [Arthrobacter sp. ISL-5]
MSNASISGKVTAPAGVDLTSVGITVHTAEAYSYTGWGEVAADGSYTVSGLPAGSYKVQFGGSSSGALNQWYSGASSFDSATPVTLTAGQSLAGIDAALIKGASISGHVTVPAGIDPSSVGVWITSTAYGPDWYSGYGQVGQDGGYTVHGVPAGSYKIQFSGGNSGVITQWHSGASSSQTATPVTLTAGQDLGGINATLVMGASISGKVTVPAGVDPGSLQADVLSANGSYGGSTQLGADGTYKVNGLAAGSYKVRFSGYNSGTLQQWYAGASSEATATPVTLAAGEDRTGIDATLVLGASVSGTVTVPAGVNLGSIQATVYQAGGTNPHYVASSSVNDDGTYKVAGLPSGSYKVQFAGYNTGALVQWYAGASSFDAATPVALTEGQDHGGVNATLIKGASVSGKVTAPAGVNLSAVQAYLYTSDSYSYAGSADVRADGSYKFAGLAAGSYKVQFSAGSSGSLDQWYGGLSFTEATPVPVADSQDLTLSDTPLAKGASISGKVTAPAGVELSAVTASVYNADNFRSYAVNAQVQSDGTYKVTGLRAGNYKVQFAGYNTGALNQWYANATTMDSATTLPLTAGQDLTGINATLIKGASIAGKITAPAGVDLTMVNVSATGEGSANGSYGQVNADGTFAVKGLPAGTYKVSFSNYNSGALDEWYNNVLTAAEATPITLTAGQDRTAVDATLAKGASISGKVTLPAAEYSPNVFVTAFRASDNTMAGSANSNFDGTYSIRGLTPGSYKISFGSYGTGALPQWYKNASSMETATTVPVTEGQDLTAIDATLIKGGTISGKITAPAGTNLAASQVVATKNGVSNPAPVYGSVNSDGTYSVIGLEGGTYTVRFSGGQSGATDTWHGGATAASATPVTVAVSQTVTGVDMTVITGASIKGKIAGTSTTYGYPVSVLDAAGKSVKEGFSDAAGNYSVVGLAEGSYKVAFNRSSGYAQEEAQFYQNKPESAGAGQAQSLPVTAGQQVQNIDATLATGGSLTGTVLNKDGKPFADAFVHAYTPDGSLVTRASFTDAAGKYTINGLTSGKYTLRVIGGPIAGDLYSGNAATEAAATPVTVASGSATTHDLSYATEPLTAPVPTITGTAKAGSTLTAVPGTWGPGQVALSYQWKSNGTAVGLAIAGATASTYKLTAADVGKTITVTVTGTKAGYTTTAKTSVRTGTVMALNPVLSAPVPAITGTAKVGYTLTAAPGTWGPVPVALAYQWKANGIAITGATASTYKPASTVVGKTLTVTVTGTKAGYTTAAKTSAATVKVAAGTLSAPVPVITGAVKVGSTLTAAGTWGPSPVTLTYQWKANGIAITGATASTYRPAATMLGKTLTVTVTGSKAGYIAVAKTSAATARVAAGTLTAPVPGIAGTAKVGYTLTATGAWGPAPVALRYQWKANGIAITGATASTYRPVSTVVGKTLTVTVTGAKTGYTTVAKTSAATLRVAAGTLTAPAPRITGTVRVGYTLTAVPGTWGPAPVTLTYQWKANGIAITGATASTYKPVAAVRGKILTVTVTGRKAGYTAVARTSAATVKVV